MRPCVRLPAGPRRPSPALVISVIALLLALGGTGYAASKIGSKQIRNNSIRGKDVKKNTLTGANVNEPSLDASSFTVGRSAQQTGACDPNTAAFVNCVAVTLNLPRSGRVLLIGDGVAEDQGVPGSEGACRFDADSTVVGGSTMSVYASAPPDSEDFSATAVTSPLNAGPHSFQFSCNQVSPEGIVFEQTQISAVMVGAG